MAEAAAAPVDILALESRLVSPLCGVIRRLHRVYKDVAEPEMPFIWRAEVSNHRFAPEAADQAAASGKGFDPASARRRALGEAVERYCALRVPAGATRARRADLPGRAIDPAALVLYEPGQYAQLPYTPWDEDLVLDWIEGECLTESGPCWLPVQSVYLDHPADQPLLAQQSSNGLAAGATRADALLRALLELVERDAFMAAWYGRLAPRRVDWRSHPDAETRGLAERYRRRGVEMHLLRLPADHDIAVFAAIGIERAPGGVAAVVGLGCDLSPASAATGALLEVGQVRPALRMKLRDPERLARRAELVAAPERVSALEDHDLLYTDQAMLGAFDMWLGGEIEPGSWKEPAASTAEARLTAVLASLRAIGAVAHGCAVTTPDMAGLGLHVFRAVIEHFQPIHFGEAETRFGGGRLYDFPRLIGLADAPMRRDQLNPLPHPLS